MERLSEVFIDHPSQGKVADMMLRLGVTVRGGKAYCGTVELSDTAIGRAAGTDRRVARSAIDRVSNDPILSEFFAGLRSIALLSDVAPMIGCSTLEIIPTNASIPGILADVSAVTLAAGMSIRQAVIDDPDGKSAHLLIVLDGNLPTEFIPALRQCRGVASLILK
ncbi:MAG: regulator of amino acid metabolism, contains ACT domain protein [Methanomassiliicoccaceae archaeon]|jgi:predicted regulator of amino acid metabolism with ACT domain|nr:regulator of amino acid metabolism, contains ACT domain protein [Methanomassiliicoccaceae archaeon]